MNPFKIGDRVRCCNGFGATGALINGAEYTIEDVKGQFVQVDGGGGWDHSRFELVRAEERETDKRHMLELIFGGFLSLKIDLSKPLAEDVAIAAITAATNSARLS